MLHLVKKALVVGRTQLLIEELVRPSRATWTSMRHTGHSNSHRTKIAIKESILFSEKKQYSWVDLLCYIFHIDNRVNFNLYPLFWHFVYRICPHLRDFSSVLTHLTRHMPHIRSVFVFCHCVSMPVHHMFVSTKSSESEFSAKHMAAHQWDFSLSY